MEGDLALGLILRQTRTADIALIAKTCGFDWISIDMEHSSIGIEAAAQIASACLATGVTALVRAPLPVYPVGTRLLDAGAQGLIVPHIDTADDAAAAVSSAKYPPLGQRSIASVQPQLSYREAPAAEAMAEVNREVLLVAMLETRIAIENADAIAAVSGVDVLLIGANDLMADYGLVGQFKHPQLISAIKKVGAAARKNGLFAGVSGIHDPDTLRAAVDAGVRMIGGGTDLSLFMKAAVDKTNALRKLLDR
jgi:2-keto-3-deoxy-L-rhamnonate aldolase RhmA